MTRADPDTATPPPNTESDTDVEELPEQCVAVAEETGERCENPALPVAARCHAHVDYAELSAADGDPSRERYARGGTPARGRDTLKSD